MGECSCQRQAGEREAKLANVRILIADDDQTNRELLALLLARAGASVYTASNGREAVEFALSHPVDLVLTDLHMPVMDGYAAMGRMRASGLRVPIIALSASIDSDSKEKCREAGCDSFLHKPIEFDKLVEVILQALIDSGWRRTEMNEQAELREEGRSEVGERHGQRSSAGHWASGATACGPCMAEPVGDASCRDMSVREAEPAIESSLPLDDPEFAEIVLEFVERLRERLGIMRAAWAEADFQQLADLAHWLKGCAGTVGFDQFTQPAFQLEQAARSQEAERIEPQLAAIEQLAARIRVRLAVS